MKYTLEERIEKLPGDNGWWHPDNGETYHSLAQRLVRSGLTEDEAFDVLESAYGAAADEFGS